MATVTLSPKFQLVIPKEIRESMAGKPGQKFQVFQIGEWIDIVPVRDVKELRGIAKGINTDVLRDGDRVVQ